MQGLDRKVMILMLAVRPSFWNGVDGVCYGAKILLYGAYLQFAPIFIFMGLRLTDEKPQ